MTPDRERDPLALKSGSAPAESDGVEVRGRIRVPGALLAIAVAALGGTAASAVAAAPVSTTVMVRIDPAASRSERAEVRDALDAFRSAELIPGWRAYQRVEPISLGQAQEALEDAQAAQAVEIDMPVQSLAAAPDDPGFVDQWDLQNTGQVGVLGQKDPDGFPLQGAGVAGADIGWLAGLDLLPADPVEVRVGITDTGVDVLHHELDPHILRNAGEIPDNQVDDDGNGLVDDYDGWDFLFQDGSVYDTATGDEHGTHVAGTIAAVSGDGLGTAGIAQNARIIVAKFLDNRDINQLPPEVRPSIAGGIKAIQYAVARGAQVINASWGTPSLGTNDPASSALCQAVQQAVDAGVVFVAAAGNSGNTKPVYPAACPATTFSVVATDRADNLWVGSSYGPITDLGAPGVDIASTIPLDGTDTLSGTSMASPHVVAVAAALLGLQPDLGPPEVQRAILEGATPLASLDGRTASGARLSLPGAIAWVTGVYLPDSTPPEPFGLLAPDGGSWTASATPTLRWEPATDAGAGVDHYVLSVDGATTETGPGVTQGEPAGPLAEGPHRWSVSAVDGRGNVQPTPERVVNVDLTPPSFASATAEAEPGVLHVTWTPAADPGGSGVTGQVLEVEGRAPLALPPAAAAADVALAPGEHRWRLTATDLVGRVGATAWATATVPAPPAAPAAVEPPAAPVAVAAPPAIGPGAVVVAGGRAFVRTLRVPLAITVPPGAARMTVANDAGLAGAAARPVAGALTWLLAPGRDGRRTVHVRFEGATQAAQDDVTLDRTPPRLRVRRGVVRASDAGSGVAGLQVARRRTASAAFRAGARASVVRTAQAAGGVAWVRARDRVGNVSPWRAVRLRPG